MAEEQREGDIAGNDEEKKHEDSEDDTLKTESTEQSEEEHDVEEGQLEGSLDDGPWKNIAGYDAIDELDDYEVGEIEMDEMFDEHIEDEYEEVEIKKVAFNIVEETERIGGDFKKSTLYISDKRYDKVYDFDHEEEEEEEEEEFKEEEEVKEEEELEEEFIIDRDNLYKIYHELYPGYNSIKIKNNFLQRKMVEYFTKRKMDHVMKEDANYEDNYLKYCKEMTMFYNLKMETQKTKDELLCDINTIKNQKLAVEATLLENLNKLYGREKEIGTGLIMAKTGKPIPEKLVERLIRNQMLKTEEMSTLRLHYIKIRDKIAEMEAACQKFDKIGEHYTIMDYEQLKIERRNHSDKIEERDEELSRLRRQSSNAIQCLAHIREKLAAVQDKIYSATLNLAEVEKERFQIRELLNGNKKQRDYYRVGIIRKKENAGLLTKPKLLHDMEDTMHEKDRLQSELEHLKVSTEKYKNQIECVKSHIKRNVKHHNKTIIKYDKAVESVTGTEKTKRRFFKGRPSLLTIKDSICDDFLQTTSTII